MSEVADAAHRAVAAWNAGDREGWIAAASPDIVIDGVLHGHEHWAFLFDAVRKAVPDGHKELAGPLVEMGKYGAAQIRVTGTNTGAITLPRNPNDDSGEVEVPATGKHVDYVYAAFFTVVDGLCTEYNSYGQAAGYAAAVGALSFEALGART